jgi:predicted MFS family arabinose efflux permease
MLRGLLLCQGVSPLLYMNVAAFLPEIAKVNYGFSETSIGVLFSLYQVAFLITAIYLGRHLQNFGRKRAVKYAVLLMVTSTILFSVASTARYATDFYIIASAARLCSGVAAGIVEVVVPAVIS